MRLVYKTSVIYVLISILVLLIAGLLSYFNLQSEMLDDELETVQHEQSYIQKLIKNDKQRDVLILSPDGLSKIEPTEIEKPKNNFTLDTTIFDMQEKEFVDYRFYVSYIKKQNQVYKITLAKNQHIKEEFFENVLSIIGLILTLIIVVFIVANWFISKMIWKPFFKTLTQLKSYSISEHKKFVFDPSNIFEFNALNSVLSEMTNTIYQSYEKQKEFTENASHEMQTPIAILKGNIEMLMQSENLDERDMGYIEGIELGLTKLSRLNSTLLLLAKIENKQSQSRISVNLSNVIHQILEQFNDALEFRKIEVEITLPIDFEIHIDPILVEILFSNLIQNAIRHNIEGGKIFIHNLNKSVMILNSGKPLNFESSELYDRFKKSNDSIESTGLGLAIVKSILNSYGNTIEYFYENELHIFRMNFL